jgi:hypothetical protein
MEDSRELRNLRWRLQLYACNWSLHQPDTDVERVAEIATQYVFDGAPHENLDTDMFSREARRDEVKSYGRITRRIYPDQR